jgi:hypothetical protein
MHAVWGAKCRGGECSNESSELEAASPGRCCAGALHAIHGLRKDVVAQRLSPPLLRGVYGAECCKWKKPQSIPYTRTAREGLGKRRRGGGAVGSLFKRVGRRPYPNAVSLLICQYLGTLSNNIRAVNLHSSSTSRNSATHAMHLTCNPLCLASTDDCGSWHAPIDKQHRLTGAICSFHSTAVLSAGFLPLNSSSQCYAR